jgi:hypothetical protein
MTEWRDVVGYEGSYQVSDDGQVYSLISEKVLIPYDGDYQSVNLLGKTKRVHRLVAEAFLGLPDLPYVRHLDDNPKNNTVGNLAWGTISDNQQDAVRNGKNPLANRIHCTAGHEFTEDNTVIRKDGGRRCRECEKLRTQQRAERGEYLAARRRISA